ncbi:MAG: hypothetical protein WBC93_19750 [Sulfitobacter sp.]
MVDSHLQFEKRLSLLARKHKSMANGYTTRIRGDGLIVVEPKRATFRIPIRGVVFTLIGFVMFKAFMLASLGALTYQERVDLLSGGTSVEKAGAWVMQIDAVTKKLSGIMGPYLR